MIMTTVMATGKGIKDQRQGGQEDAGESYLCTTSQGTRFYAATNDSFWDGYILKLSGDDGTIISLPVMAEIWPDDNRQQLQVWFAGRHVTVPIDSIRRINDYFRAWAKGITFSPDRFVFRREAPTTDEMSIGTSLELYADFPTSSDVASSHMRYWMSEHLFESISYQVESLQFTTYLEEEGESFGCYMANNDRSGRGMLDYYGLLYQKMYEKYIHHTVDVEMGGLEMSQGFFLQDVLPHAVTYLYLSDMYAIGNAHGGVTHSYVSFDRETGRVLTADDLFRSEDLHQLKEHVFNGVLKIRSDQRVRQGGECYQGLRNMIDEEGMASFLGCDDDAPLSIIIDSLPLHNVGLLHEGVMFYFEPYQICSFGYGPTWVLLSYDEVRPFMRDWHTLSPMAGGDLTIASDSVSNLNKRSLLMAGEHRWDEAIRQKREAAECISKLEGTDSRAYVVAEWQLLDLYIEAGLYDEAMKLINDLRPRIASADALIDLGQQYRLDQRLIQLYDLMGDYEQALCLIDSDVVDNIPHISYLNFMAGHLDKAVSLALDLSSDMQKNVSQRLSMMIGEEREREWKKIAHWYTDYLPMLANISHDDSLCRYAYDALLLGKGILLSTETSFHRCIQDSGDTEILNLYNTMQEKKERLHIMQMIGDGIEEVVEEETSRIKILEEQLISRSKRFGDFTRHMKINTSDVQRYLHSDETAIEFATYRQADSTVYLAFLLQKDMTFPTPVLVCTESELAECVKGGTPDLRRLHDLVWQRIERQVAVTSTILFSPSGLLHSLPVEYAMTTDGTLYSKYHTLCRLTSTRQIVLDREDTEQRKDNHYENGILFGGIDYNIVAYTPRDSPYQDLNNLSSRHHRGALTLDVDSFNYLPATLEEVEGIKQILEQSKYPSVMLYKKGEAAEFAFKKLSGCNLQFLHVATHGFYFSGDQLDNVTHLGHLFSSFNHSAQTEEEKALLNSGLLMAGANRVLSEKVLDDNNDGILTASEISLLDLSGLKTVVLSACQTACGQLAVDGVFGLQRGFKKAGVNTILMSLWKVDDDATCLLMTEFYKHWIGEGNTKYNALQLAEESVRSHKEMGWDDPEYWAAFIILDALD